MKSMNLFNRKGESSEALFGDTKPKETTDQLPPAPIQDENGNLTFCLEGKTYSIDADSEEERERVKEEVNANSLAKYDWFKEETGVHHWVLYDTEMYEVTPAKLLHYRECSGLIPVIPINATSCSKMFSWYKSLTQLDLSNFNTVNIVDMSYMFTNCKELIQLDLSNFNTHNVINMCGMFCSCRSLTQLDLSNFDTSQVTNMHMMFYDCKRLTKLDVRNFDTSNVTNMCGMFCNCRSLTQLDLSNFDTSQVIIMKGMFYNCKELTQLAISNFNTSEVVTMTEMFAYCIRLTDIFISNKWNINRVDFSFHMFVGCLSLPNFNEENTYIKMAKPVEEGGYLTLKN